MTLPQREEEVTQQTHTHTLALITAAIAPERRTHSSRTCTRTRNGSVKLEAMKCEKILSRCENKWLAALLLLLLLLMAATAEIEPGFLLLKYLSFRLLLLLLWPVAKLPICGGSDHTGLFDITRWHRTAPHRTAPPKLPSAVMPSPSRKGVESFLRSCMLDVIFMRR